MNGGAERTRLLGHKDIYQVTTLVILYDPYPSRGFPRTSRSRAHPSASRVPRRSLSFLPRRDSVYLSLGKRMLAFSLQI